MRETLNILLEGTPAAVSLPEIAEPGCDCGWWIVHDLHVWSLGSQTRALASHVTIADIPPSESNRILAEMKAMLLRRFRIHHTTIQFESAECEVAHGCVLAVEEEHAHDHAHAH